MTEMWIAGVVWVGSHLGISSTPLRGMLVRVFGARGYLGVYSLVAAGSLGYLIWVYTQVPRFDYLWLPDPALHWVPKLVMPVALMLLVGGFMVRNPTAVGMTLDDPATAPDLATGVTRLTRHPFQWGVVLWSTAHIASNGDWVSVVFFGSFGVVSLAGTFLMDRKKAASFGSAWQAYAAVTSNVPFAAILQGRNRLVWRELALPAAAGVGLYALLYYFHEVLFGTVII